MSWQYERKSLSEKPAAGEVPVGHMVFEFGTPGLTQILEAVDVDFVVVAMEHTGFDGSRIADQMA